MQSIYQKAVPLRPGLYRLDLVIKDVQSGNVGVVNSRLAVPRYNDEKLEASSLIIADQSNMCLPNRLAPVSSSWVLQRSGRGSRRISQPRTDLAFTCRCTT